MSIPEPAHWIDGAWRAGASEIVFEAVTFVAPRPVWPRGDARDADAATDAATRASERWLGLARRERVRCLRAWLAALEADATLPGAFEASLGLDADEAQVWSERELFHARQALEIVADDVAERPGVGVFGAHWSDGVGRLAARALSALAGGAALAVVADPRFGGGPAALARAAGASGLPAGVFNVLFDDGRAVLDRLLGDPRVAFARLAGREPRLAELARAARPGLSLALRPAVSASRALPDDLDPAQAAAEVFETSFSRSVTLSGQLPGRLGRVLCPRRHFSRFSEELLAALERHPDATRPAPLIESDALDALQEAWFLGLDEGATPLHGGPPWFPAAEGLTSLGGGGPGKDRGGVRRALGVRPVIFTNVDPNTRFGRFRRNVPVLGLMRVRDARVGQALARSLDA
ncbi:MAG: aldehyde dehydrogenase family protein [Planctomycetes bacterium]|nr:aldehyde dehydrogenase family protein [Planctomycetota bacterium]